MFRLNPAFQKVDVEGLHHAHLNQHRLVNQVRVVRVLDPVFGQIRIQGYVPRIKGDFEIFYCTMII